jgi:hypothetical protein
MKITGTCPVVAKGKKYYILRSLRRFFMKKIKSGGIFHLVGMFFLSFLFAACFQLNDEISPVIEDTEKSESVEETSKTAESAEEASKTAESAGEEPKTEEPEYAEIFAVSEDSSNLTKTYKKIVGLELSYAQKGVETIQAYIDLPEENARSVGAGPIDFSEIGRYLPSDISALKRIKQDGSRNALIEEVSLEDELNSLVEEFSLELQEALPDPAPALTLPFVTGTDEGLLIGGDTLIPYGSVEGAITVEVLNAAAAGEDVEALIEELQEELSPLIGEEDAASRALTMNSGVDAGRWPGGGQSELPLGLYVGVP